MMVAVNVPPVEEYKGPSLDGPVNLNTLTDISQFLSEQNSKLDSQIQNSGDSIEAFTVDLDKL